MNQGFFLLLNLCYARINSKNHTFESRDFMEQLFINFREKVKQHHNLVESMCLSNSDGVIWSEQYIPRNNRNIYSHSKSFTSLMVGIAIDEGMLTLDTRLSDVFKDEMTEEEYNKLMELYGIVDEVQCLNYLFTPHITLAYYNRHGFDASAARKLEAVIKELNEKEPFEIVLNTGDLYYQKFTSMNQYYDVFNFVSVK